MTIKTLLGNKGKKSKLVGFTFSTAPVLTDFRKFQINSSCCLWECFL